ncbi:hypothetical protein Tco_1325048 [Tanacetum coccineum]
MNYMKQPVPNPDEINDTTTTMNMALVLMAKAFKLNYSTPTNNNQRILSNPCNRQIAQLGMNMGQDRQMQMVGGNSRNQFRQYVGNQIGYNGGQIARNQIRFNAMQNAGNQVVQNAVQNLARAEGNGNENNGNQIRCYNCRGLDHYARNYTVRLRRRDAAYLQTQLLIAQKEEAGIQLQAEEFDLMAAACDINEIKEVNANSILMANLQQASTSGTQIDKAPVYNSDGSAEAKSFEELENEHEHLLRAFVSQDIMCIMQSPSVVDTSDLQTELDPTKEKFENCIIKRENEFAKLWNDCNTKNDRGPSTSKISFIKNKEVEVEDHPRNLLLSKDQKHMSSECNIIKLAIRNDKSEVVYAICNQCLITTNHDVYVLNYVNDMNSRVDNQNANVLNIANQNKHKAKVKKLMKLGSKERLASPKPRKPRTCLRWSPTRKKNYLTGKLIQSSDSECQCDNSESNNACDCNHQEPTSKRFPNSTSFHGRLSKFAYGVSTRVAPST